MSLVIFILKPGEKPDVDLSTGQRPDDYSLKDAFDSTTERGVLSTADGEKARQKFIYCSQLPTERPKKFGDFQISYLHLGKEGV